MKDLPWQQQQEFLEDLRAARSLKSAFAGVDFWDFGRFCCPMLMVKKPKKHGRRDHPIGWLGMFGVILRYSLQPLDPFCALEKMKVLDF